jgi:hypothetical protein
MIVGTVLVFILGSVVLNIVKAGEADIVDVVVGKQGDGQFRFDVKVRRAD